MDVVEMDQDERDFERFAESLNGRVHGTPTLHTTIADGTHVHSEQYLVNEGEYGKKPKDPLRSN